MKRAFILSVSMLALSSITSAKAQVPDHSPIVARNLYGEMGLLDTPSARMASDGIISFTVGAIGGSQRINFDFQVMPWLDGTFRYSHIQYPNLPQGEFDRSLGFKMRLSREDAVLPELSIGVRDILGTGLYGAEYVVLSKRMGDFDLTLGGGWGRLAGSGELPNPLKFLSSTFDARGASAATGGTVNLNQLFHGPSLGLFGGLNWRTPIEGLDAIVELSSDRYTLETAGGLKRNTPINIGFKYDIFDTLSLSGAWMYGSTFGIVGSFSLDPNVSQPGHLALPVPSPVYRSEQDQERALAVLAERKGGRDAALKSVKFGLLDLDEGLDAIGHFRDYEIDKTNLIINAGSFADAARFCERYAGAASVHPGLTTVAITDVDQHNGRVKLCPVPREINAVAVTGAHTQTASTTDIAAQRAIEIAIRKQDIELVELRRQPGKYIIYYRNGRYAIQDEAIGRLTRVLMANSPPNVEIFEFVLLVGNLPTSRIQVERSSLERTIAGNGTAAEMGLAINIDSAPSSDNLRELPSAKHIFTWAIGPSGRLLFFDPNVPLQGEAFVYASAGIRITQDLQILGLVEANIINNYDKDLPAASELPHVRTDQLKYFDKGLNGIQTLYAQYDKKLGTDFYSEFKVGYLEDMFGGGGGQLVWRPDNGRWAFGADGYEVWQRNYDRLFGLMSYHTFTGHISAYYQSPWGGVNFAVHAGRYLAKDYGATFEIRRQFNSGMEIGAFATFTNVPFSKFGEGSFDKGIYIYIPFEWTLPVFTRGGYPVQLRSITRDGGARLAGDDSLYWVTRDAAGPALREQDDQIVRPQP